MGKRWAIAVLAGFAGTLGCGGDDSSATAATGGSAGAASGGTGGSAGTASGGTGGSAGTTSGGTGGSAGTASGGTGGSAGTCPLPSGALTRNPSNPLVKNGPEAYDGAKAGPRVVVVMGPSDYRMWYEAVATAWSNGTGVTSIAYATSTDGLTWTKKGVVMSPDSSTWEKSEVSPQSIVVENGTFRLYYHGGGYPSSTGARLGNARIGYATSNDGSTWTKQSQPILDIGPSGSFDDDQAAEPRVLAVAGAYRMYYTGHNAQSGKNALGMATSSDGVTWTKSAQNPILDVNAWGNFWGGAFFHENGVWHLWHGVASGGASSLHYMSSADGITWSDGPANPVLSQSTDSGAPDYGLVGDSVSGYRDDASSSYRIMYTGFNSNLFGSQGRFEGICMASVAAPCP